MMKNSCTQGDLNKTMANDKRLTNIVIATRCRTLLQTMIYRFINLRVRNTNSSFKNYKKAYFDRQERRPCEQRGETLSKLEGDFNRNYRK